MKPFDMKGMQEEFAIDNYLVNYLLMKHLVI